jgi:hypothetical protein
MPKDKEKDDDIADVKEKDETEELVVVTDDKKNLDVEPTGPQGDDDAPVKRSKNKKGKAEDDDDDDQDDDEDEEDTRLGKSEDKSDEAEEDERKRTPHKTRRQRRREAENRLKTELRFLEGRNDQLERTVQTMARRLDSNDKTNLETRITHTKAMIRKAESVMEEAADAEKGGKALVEATRIRDGLRDDLGKLEMAKDRSEKQETPQSKVDPRVVKRAESWAKNYNQFQGWTGTDVRIVRAIDDAVAEEGFDPTSKDYWNEMDKRIAKYLPHRVGESDEEDDEDEDEEEERPRKKKKKQRAASKKDDEDDDDEDGGKRPKNGGGGPRFRTGGPGRDLRPNEVYLNAERIAALKESGAWEDPILRKKMLKRYQDYDREHANDRDR